MKFKAGDIIQHYTEVSAPTFVEDPYGYIFVLESNKHPNTYELLGESYTRPFRLNKQWIDRHYTLVTDVFRELYEI